MRSETFGELDEEGKSNLASFAAQASMRFAFMPVEGRLAQGSVPPLPIAASGSGRAVDQPDTARLCELLCVGRSSACFIREHEHRLSEIRFQEPSLF
jgi:hypothetical protein